MSASELLVWGIVVHLICDWPLQNDWMANNKAKRRTEYIDWWAVLDRHPAAYVHAGIHTLGMLLVFPAWAALLIGLSHLLIDTRVPVVWWSQLIRQTQPNPATNPLQGFDVGWEVRFWTDQVFHIAVIALMALVVA